MNPLNLIRVMPAQGTEQIRVAFLAARAQCNCDGEEDGADAMRVGSAFSILRRSRFAVGAITSFAALMIHSTGVVAADESAVSPTVAEAPADSGEIEKTTTGWVKAFALAPVARGGPFEAPDYAGSLLESSGRKEMKRRLAAMGFVESAAGADLLTFSIRIEEPKPKAKGLPQSPVRLEGVDDDPTDNIHDPEVRPYIALPSGKKPSAAPAPSIEVTIYARRGGERVWSGYAGAPMNGASRAETAHGLVRALIAHFGETADLPEISIELARDASEAPALER
ncbi:MAG: hypothetical protein ACOZAA_06510 [Pseudomonadota bacterium]